MKQEKIKYHRALLEIIDKFKKPKWGKLISRNEAFDGLSVRFKPAKKEFSFQFTPRGHSKKVRALDVGQYHKNVEVKFGNDIFKLESLHLSRHAPPTFTGHADKIHTKGYSEKKQYYYQLVVPLDKEILFHYKIKDTVFATDLGYRSIQSVVATISGEAIQACCIKSDKKDFFLVLDSDVKQTFEEFSQKVFAVKVGIGYLTGHYPGNQGYFFAYGSKQKKEPKYFRCVQFRDSIRSGYSPVHANAYSYLHRHPLAKKYYPLLRPVSQNEFSALCEKIYGSIELSSLLMLILESSIASLLFMPGGYAIALETLSDLIIGKKKTKLAPIKDKKLSQKNKV